MALIAAAHDSACASHAPLTARQALSRCASSGFSMSALASAIPILRGSLPSVTSQARVPESWS